METNVAVVFNYTSQLRNYFVCGKILKRSFNAAPSVALSKLKDRISIKFQIEFQVEVRVLDFKKNRAIFMI